MPRDRLFSSYRSNMVDALHKLVRLSLSYNSWFTINQHVAWVVENFGLVQADLPGVVKCPKHGWVQSLRRKYGNRCVKCHKNRVLYRKRVSKRTGLKE